MTRLRVLLVEDDSTFRRYVAMALEDLPVDLVMVETVAQALEALSQGAFGLAFVDLTLPDGDGLEVLDRLRINPQAAVGRTVVMSGTLGADARARAQALGAWRVLEKPVPMRVLADCVVQTLQAGRTESNRSASPPIPAGFAGNAALFAAFKASSVAQFQDDVRAGDAACRDRDIAALRRQAHSLKTVLALLGADAASAQARELESAAADEAARMTALEPLWRSLRAAILALD